MSELERIRAFLLRTMQGASERTVAVPGGAAMLVDALPRVYDVNYVHAAAAPPPSAQALAAAADEAMAHLHHRKVIVEEAGAELAQELVSFGYDHAVHLVMAHHREPDRVVDTSMVREASRDELKAARRATSLRQWGDEELSEMLASGKARAAAAVGMRHFAAYADSEIAAYCELRGDGDVGQIEDVYTVQEFRGRGLGRALVHFAVERARDAHDLVFLEALDDDWPKDLYGKLGFDVVGARQLFLRTPHPLTALRLRTPRLELRIPTIAELRELGGVAQRGVHPPGEMPFMVAWTDRAQEPGFVEEFVGYHRGKLANWRAEDWNLELVVFLDGKPVGAQGLTAKRFAETHFAGSGSWLGQEWQDRGLGTEMRTAIVELAFRCLGADAVGTAAAEGNFASLGVTRKLGYRRSGETIATARGEPIVHPEFRLERADWRPPVAVEIEGCTDAVRAQFTG